MAHTPPPTYGPIRHHQSKKCGHDGKRKLLNGGCAECLRIELDEFRPIKHQVVSRFYPLLENTWRTPPLETIEPPLNKVAEAEATSIPGKPIVKRLPADIFKLSTLPLVDLLALRPKPADEPVHKMIQKINLAMPVYSQFVLITKIFSDLKAQLFAGHAKPAVSPLAMEHATLKTNYFLIKVEWYKKHAANPAPIILPVEDEKFIAVGSKENIEQVFIKLSRILSFKDGQIKHLDEIFPLISKNNATAFSLRSLLNQNDLHKANDTSSVACLFDELDILFSIGDRLHQIIDQDEKNVAAYSYLPVTYLLQLKMITHYYKYKIFADLGLKNLIDKHIAILQLIIKKIINSDPQLNPQIVSDKIQALFRLAS